MYRTIKELGFDKPLEEFNHEDLERFLFYLEDEKKLSSGSLWNYKKLVETVG